MKFASIFVFTSKYVGLLAWPIYKTIFQPQEVTAKVILHSH